MTTDPHSYVGAKLAILVGDNVLTLLRDDRPDIPFPGMWDLPGGAREGGEPPDLCALRETREELGLDLSPEVIVWRRAFASSLGHGIAWFFVADLPELDLGRVRMGDEGQRWRVMPIAEFLENAHAVPHLQHRLRTYFEDTAIDLGR